MATHSGYEVFERIYYLLQRNSFDFLEYCRQFDISRRTAFRDLNYLKEYQDIDVECYEGRYYLHKLRQQQIIML